MCVLCVPVSSVVVNTMATTRRLVYFLGLEMPYEARLSLRTMPTLEAIEPILQAVLANIVGRTEGDASRRLQQAMSLDSATLGALFTGVHWIVRACMRSGMKAKALAVELADIKVPPPFVEPILTAVEEGCAAATRAWVALVGTRSALTQGARMPVADGRSWYPTGTPPTLRSCRP